MIVSRCLPAAVCLLALLAMCAGPAIADEKPNIVLIVADYMGASDIGPTGATDIRTPSLDALAAAGTRYRHHYAAAPICGPSRAALLTGRYPARVGFEANIRGNEGLSPELGTLPGWLADAGYATGAVGKWHLGRTPLHDPLAHGFDEFYGFHDWTIHYYTHRNGSGRESLLRQRRVIEEDGYLTELLADEGARFIERHRNEPFFLYLAFNAALPPYLPPGVPPEEWEVGFEVGDAVRDDYVGMVEAMDAGIGRVLRTLDRLGIEENTLVVFTYDHNGRHLVRNAPFSGGFATLEDGGLRVPLILRWPGRVAGNTVVDEPTIAMDLTATILDAADADVEPTLLDGSSLFGSGTDRRSRPLFWRATYGDHELKAARQGRWKLRVDRLFPFASPTIYLHDIENNPGESEDLFHRHKDVAMRMLAAIDAWEAGLAAEH